VIAALETGQSLGDGDLRLTFETWESSVRSYCRRFPVVLTRAKGHMVWDRRGRSYLDFMSGAGALNYGHNHDRLRRALLRYIEEDGIAHSLDFHTEAKARFIQEFNRVILAPRGLEYRFQFTGPTGTNAVEAALKVARRATGRQSVVAFTNGFHGMTLGALAAAGSRKRRVAAGVPLHEVIRLPFDGYGRVGFDGLDYLQAALDDPSSGIDAPAAVLLEVVQGEGGLNAASAAWLQRVQSICRERGILFIVDDIQAGCGRTGPFFSFDGLGVQPDIVCLAKSIGGYGLPLALILIKPWCDRQEPGEHAGTFRGNNLAFVTGAAALSFWTDTAFLDQHRMNCDALNEWLQRLPGAWGVQSTPGRGMMRGMAWGDPTIAGKVSAAAFERGVIIETCGGSGQVLKLMPPLVIEPEALRSGLRIIAEAIAAVSDDQ